MTITIGIVIALLIIGFFSGMLSGLVGVGGGIIIVPCLVFFLALTQKQAQGTSLAVLTLPVVFLGMWQYYKNGHIDFKIVVLLAIGFVIGGYFGGKIANKISDDLLKKIFGVVLLLIAIRMLFFDDKKKSTANKNNVTTVEQHQSK
ncbi:MAG: sulfite exporter TauE/SafE family protein [Chitinophagaceae bacterium]